MTRFVSEKFSGRLWVWITASASAISILVGGVVWAANVDAKANKALEQNTEQSKQIETLTSKVDGQSRDLAEIKAGMNYLVKTMDEVKQEVKKR